LRTNDQVFNQGIIESDTLRVQIMIPGRYPKNIFDTYPTSVYMHLTAEGKFVKNWGERT